MTYDQALNDLMRVWPTLPEAYRMKWRQGRSKLLSGRHYIGRVQLEKMLTEAGYRKEEKWVRR